MKRQPFVGDLETYDQDLVNMVREPVLMLDTAFASDPRTGPFIRPFNSLRKKPRTV